MTTYVLTGGIPGRCRYRRIVATKTRQRKKPLTASEADRAIYIDFEGNQGRPPTFLGAACEGEWGVTVLEPEFRSVVDWGHPRGTVGFAEPLTTLESIRRRAIDEDRRVVAWSIHELDEIRSYYRSDDGAVEWWADNLINALPIAKKWASTHRVALTPVRDFRSAKPRAKTTTALVCFMEAVGYQKHRQYARGKTGKGISDVRSQLARRGDFGALTPVAKSKWTNLLNHNRDDCVGLRAVMIRASGTY